MSVRFTSFCFNFIAAPRSDEIFCFNNKFTLHDYFSAIARENKSQSKDVLLMKLKLRWSDIWKASIRNEIFLRLAFDRCVTYQCNIYLRMIRLNFISESRTSELSDRVQWQVRSLAEKSSEDAFKILHYAKACYLQFTSLQLLQQQHLQFINYTNSISGINSDRLQIIVV